MVGVLPVHHGQPRVPLALPNLLIQVGAIGPDAELSASPSTRSCRLFGFYQLIPNVQDREHQHKCIKVQQSDSVIEIPAGG